MMSSRLRSSWPLGWTIAVVAMPAIILAGCARTDWVKAGADEATRDADLARCEDFARDEVDNDFVDRITDTQRGVTAGRDEFGLRSELQRYDTRGRRIALIASCMRQLGYGESETEPQPDANGDDANGDNGV